MVRKSIAAVLLITVAVLAASCDLPTGCDTYAAAGINVLVRDARTGAALSGDGLRVIARDGTYADTARGSNVGLAYERPGTYLVTAEAPGYRTWEQAGVRVRKDGCHVRAVALTASLQPVP